MSVDLAVRRALSNPDSARRAIQIIRAERSLIDFIEMFWHVLEPGKPFKRGWVIEAVCEHLEAVSRGEIRRLLINVPPGCMKSLTVSVFWPVWEWTTRPYLRYVCWSYTDTLTIRDNRKCRRLIQSALFQECWGHVFQLSGDQNEKKKIETTETGYKIATSFGGMATGERGDRLIIDDPHNVKDGESETRRENTNATFFESISSRTNDEDCSLVATMQRIHGRDLSGMILLKLRAKYDHLCLPMRHEKEHPTPSKTTLGFVDPRREEGDLLFPELFPESRVDEQEEEMSAWGGSYAVSGQMQQRPTPRKGGMFQRKDFQIVDEAPRSAVVRCRGWDLAATSQKENPDAAYTAGVKMSRTPDGRIFIEDVRRIQGSTFQVEELLEEVAAQDGKIVQDLPQDPGQAGKSQKPHLAAVLHGVEVRFSPETGSKESRARPLSAQAEAGSLFLVRGPWNDAFINEATEFPGGTYRDQVDAASRAYARVIRKKRKKTGAAPERIIGG